MIKTERLSLRSIEEKDFDAYKEIYAKDNIRYLLIEDFTYEEFKNRLNDTKRFSVLLDDTVIGTVSLKESDMPGSFELGYVFSKAYQHQGYAKEAVESVINYGFKELKAHRIFAIIDPRNDASCNLCKRLNMRKEAHFIKDYYSKGEWTDTYIFALLDNEIK